MCIELGRRDVTFDIESLSVLRFQGQEFEYVYFTRPGDAKSAVEPRD